MNKYVIDKYHTNFLEYPVSAAYLEVKELLAYYNASHSIHTAREIHEDLIPVLTRFIELASIPESLAAIDRLFYEESQVHPSVDAEWMELLNLSHPLSFETIKKQYRRAAMKYHPDRATGNTELMKKINEAYLSLHNHIEKNQYKEDDSWEETSDYDDSDYDDSDYDDSGRLSVKNAQEFLWKSLLTLFNVHLDDYDILIALQLYKRLMDITAKHSAFFLQEFYLSLSFSGCTLVKRLYAAGMTEDAWSLFKSILAREGEPVKRETRTGITHEFGVSTNSGFWASGDCYSIWDYAQTRTLLDGIKKPRFILNHRRQVENAYRFGLIDSNRYSDNMRRLKAKDSSEIQLQNLIDKFLVANVFIQHLPTDVFIKPVNITRDRIEDPSSYDIENLTDEQQTIYLKSFSPNGTLENIRKYQYVRINSLQRSIIEFGNDDILERTKNECQLISKLQRTKNQFIGVCERIDALCDYFLRLNDADRKERLAVLCSLHRWARPIIKHYYTHSNRCPYETIMAAVRVAISPSINYCQFSMSPIEDLKQFREFHFKTHD